MPSPWNADVQEANARAATLHFHAQQAHTTPWGRHRAATYRNLREWAHLAGQGEGQCDRFTVHAPTYDDATHIAADLSWWRHCWTWEPYPHGTYIVDTQPE